jgi:glycosyl transferase family 87
MRESRDEAKRLQSTQEPHPRERQVRSRVAQVVATVAAAIIVLLIVRNKTASLRSDERRPEEFMAFYTVGRMLNESSSELYKADAFLKEYDRLFPRVTGGTPLYAHAPFEGLVFRPFARLPFKSALVAWQAVSVAFICAGFSLVWLSGESLPRSLLPLALLLALSFQPVSVSLIFDGQVSALLFLWIAVAIWFQRQGREYGTGVALSLCLSKPTLLILLLPMFGVGRRWRTLLGFLCGTALVGAVSLLVVGWRGCLDYILTLLKFGRVATSASEGVFSPPSLWVDLNSFIRMLTGWSGAVPLLLLAALGACVVPWLVRFWRHVPEGWTTGLRLTWACTITWTMLLNVYVPRYDTPIIMLGILLMVDALLATGQGRLPLLLQILFGLLYVVPWIPPVPISGGALLQPYTVILAALGTYQLWLAMSLGKAERAS